MRYFSCLRKLYGVLITSLSTKPMFLCTFVDYPTYLQSFYALFELSSGLQWCFAMLLSAKHHVFIHKSLFFKIVLL